MPLDRAFGQEQLNIKRMANFPEKKKDSGLPFDAERDITEEDWDNIQEYLAELVRNEEWINLFESAASVAIIFPERVAELPLQGLLGIVKNVRRHFEEQGDRDFMLDHGVETKILFPEEFANIHFSEETWEEIKLLSKNSFLYQQDIKLLSPKRASEWEIGKNPESLFDLVEQLKEEESWQDFAIEAMTAKILFQEEFNRTFTLDESLWNKLHRKLNYFRRNRPMVDFIHLAKCMKFLAAKKIHITEEKIDIIMPKKKEFGDTNNIPLPRTKKF